MRVEPTGDTVIAGAAAPDSTVEVLDAGKAVATARANERGEWALSLDKPLDPGTHDLAIRTTTADKATVTLSDQRVAVEVPEKGSKDVLVVINAARGREPRRRSARGEVQRARQRRPGPRSPPHQARRPHPPRRR